MKEKLLKLCADAKEAIAAAKTEQELQNVKVALLGKTGEITGLLKELPKIAPELRPEMGKAVNEAKNSLTELIEARREEIKLKASEVASRYASTEWRSPSYHADALRS